MKEESCIKKIIASIVRSLNIKHIGDYLYRLPLQYMKDVSSPMVDDGARWEDIHKTLCWTFLKHTIDELIRTGESFFSTDDNRIEVYYHSDCQALTVSYMNKYGVTVTCAARAYRTSNTRRRQPW